MPIHHAPARLAFALCLITLAVNLQAPLYIAYAELSGRGAAATAMAFSGYVLGVLPVLLLLGGLADRVGVSSYWPTSASAWRWSPPGCSATG